MEKCLTPESVQELTRAAEKKFGGMYDLTFAEFWNCCDGDFSRLGDMERPTVLQVYWLRRFEEFTKEFAKIMRKLTLPATPDEKAASEGLLQLTWGESMLVFLQGYFGTKSFKEAEQITVGELIMAKRAQYNKDKFARRLAQIQQAKFSKK